MKNVEDIHPLSPMQQGMLFQTLFNPSAGAYFEHFSCALTGSLDTGVFKRAWQEMVNRHQILRSAFVWEKLEEPLQIVRQQVKLPWVEQDWIGQSPAEQRAGLEAYFEADRMQGFNLNKAPLIRISIIRLSEETHQLILSFSHLLLDGWSLPLLLKEVFAYYHAYLREEQLQLPSPRPYRDYIAWLQQQDMTTAETFWRRTLDGFTAPTPLLAGHLTAETGNFEEYFIQLSAQETTKLQKVTRDHQLTLNTLVQGMWALLLSRYSGHRDVVFGAVVSGRPSELDGVEEMIGLFINTLPVRVQVNEGSGVVEWLKDVQTEQVEARQYEYSPLVQVQGWSDVPRGVPLFESVLSFQNFPVENSVRAQSKSLEIETVRSTEKPTFPLNIKIMPGERLALRFVYDCRRLPSDAIARMAKHLRSLLENISAHTELPLWSLPLMDQAERQQVLVDWNDTRTEHAEWECIHHLFEAQVERTPEATALVFETESLSYRELNERANQLGNHLRTLGVGPDVLVGICMDSPRDMVLGILGILKAGGAYVPLDPTYPLERLALMVEDAEVPVVLTQEWLSDRLPSSWAQTINLDGDSERIAEQSAANPVTEVVPENLAYVIYTSGSTGQPKGVMLAHSGVNNLSAALAGAGMVSSASRILQFASFSFDASVWETFPALLNGATLCLATAESLQPGGELLQTLEEAGITTVTLPPTALAVLDATGLEKLGTIISAGEACTSELVSRWGAGRRFINAYGPTEVTVCATMAEGLTSEANPVIGRPLPNTQVYVLDERQEPVPVGVAGELYIGGDGLARGYLNRAELTAERFVPHPYSAEGGARLYRTGDLVKYQMDGKLEFLGRLDHQVKVRGYRIELGEIEAALCSYAGVSDCIVIAREDEAGEKRLVAYLVAASEVMLSELRSYLKERLPEYMVPAVFVMLGELPLTPNGKVDRRALPEPDGARPELADGYVAPGTVLETALADIWADVLRVTRVGIHDNFFALGGHSLLAALLVTRLREVLNVELTLRSLFETPTVSDLAASIERANARQSVVNSASPDSDSTISKEQWSPGSNTQAEIMNDKGAVALHDLSSAVHTSLVRLQPYGFKPPFFCVHPAGGNVFGFVELSNQLGTERRFYGLQSCGLSADGHLHTRVEEMAAFYLEALQVVQPAGPYFLGGWSMGGVVAYEMAQQLTEQGNEVALLALIDTRAPNLNGQAIELDEADLTSSFAQDLALSWSNPDFSWAQFLELGGDERLDYVLKQGKETNILRHGFNLADMRLFVDVFKANVKALAHYIPAPYLGRVTLFSAGEQSIEESPDPTKGWGLLAAAGVDCHAVPGNHYTMLRAPYVHALANRLNQCFELTEEVQLSIAAAG